jgi:uncharacterized membrane protein
MLYYLKLYLLTFIAFLAIDAVWLGLVAKDFYAKHLGYLMGDQANLLAALFFYLIFVVAILVLIVVPNLQAPLAKTLLMAALFGFASYATYDLTNLATIKDWPVIVTVVDLIWGTSIATVTAFIARLIAQRL